MLGASNSSYFEGVEDYKMVMTEEEVDMAVRKVAEVLNNKFKGEKIILVGILKGAFIFMAQLVRYLTRPYSIYFVEASSYRRETLKLKMPSRLLFTPKYVSLLGVRCGEKCSC